MQSTQWKRIWIQGCEFHGVLNSRRRERYATTLEQREKYTWREPAM